MITLAQRLNEALQIRGIKPAHLAKATGISKVRISQYLRGIYGAREEALIKMADALNVNLEWLKGFAVPMDQDRATTLRILNEQIEQLSDSEFAFVLGLVKYINSQK